MTQCCVRTTLLALLSAAFIASTCLGQTAPPADVRELPPAQTIEREMTGAETHRYTVKTREGEFTQVRLEQKGIDLKLALLDEVGNTVAMMDGFNEANGPEILSFASATKHSYVLVVTALNPQAPKGAYSVRREPPREPTPQDSRRIEVERLMAEGIQARDTWQTDLALAKLQEAERGWAELRDEYFRGLTASAIHFIKAGRAQAEFSTASALLNQGGPDAYRQALGEFQSAAKLYAEVAPKVGPGSVITLEVLTNTRWQATSLNWAGYTANILGDTDSALKLLTRALNINRELSDKPAEANTLSQIATIHSRLGDKQSALDAYQQAIALFQATGDRKGEAATLLNAGTTYFYFGDKQSALDYYSRGLELYKAAGDAGGQASALSFIGGFYELSNEQQKALDYFNRTLLLYRAAGDVGGEVTTLIHLGVMLDNVGDQQQALGYYSQALPLYKKIPNKASVIYQSAGDLRTEAVKLMNIGVLYGSLGENQAALDFYNQAITISTAIGDNVGLANIYNRIGSVYLELGDKNMALASHNMALPLMKSVGEKDGEGATRVGIGMVYLAMSEPRKALDEYFVSAQSLFAITGNKLGQASTLGNMGSAYLNLGEKEKALNQYRQSLQLYREMDNKSGEATALTNIGSVYSAMGEAQKALDYQNQTLTLLKAIGNKTSEIKVLYNIGTSWEALGNHRMAIFYCKEAVNELQDLRKGLDRDLHRTFLRNSKQQYQELVSLLVREGQLEQAVQVLNLYQDQQFFDLNRGPELPFGKLALSPRERRYEAELEEAGQAVARLGDLKRRVGARQLTAEEASQLARLKSEAEAASKKYRAILNAAAKEFAGTRDAQDEVSPVAEVMLLKDTLRTLGEETKRNTVALYTMAGAREFFLMVVSPSGVKSFVTPITSEDLEEKVLQFYALLRSPVYDPRILGKELHDIILKPAESELRRQGARTLLWSLDGSLRYVPMAALWDGEKYLVERYQNVEFTRADPERMRRPVSAAWKGAGFGTSKEQNFPGFGFTPARRYPSLPGVATELDYLFRGTKPILQGDVFLDKQFTRMTFYEALKGRLSVVHISSHFRFSPGNEWDSYLVFGDGSYLTLYELKTNEKLFDGVEMLTLSACNTAATQPDAAGKEIDGFAELAQRQGANAVMATLWQVSDCSTPRLMRNFYATKVTDGVTKAEALRNAQLALLNGVVESDCAYEVEKGGAASEALLKVVLDPSKRHRDRTRSDTVYVSEGDAPLFVRDERRPYAHPYYWSPFILYGNWR
jgi:CHAT domain-containing protein/Flp pilus assembly protein TadD